VKINFKQKLKGIDGKNLQGEDGDLPLSIPCMQAVLVQAEGDKPDGKEKFDRYKLAEKIQNGGELDIEEVAKIKDLVGKIYTAAIVGPVWLALEKAK